MYVCVCVRARARACVCVRAGVCTLSGREEGGRVGRRRDHYT